ncbi:MAG TPA: hypothetical protein VNT75_24900 [Symbiobacteriaceae bacterium]|nr:hypothetical protein [Symbiobacteriaceae bacterium]
MPGIAFTLEIIIALEKRERVSRAWWARRLAEGARRAGGLPPDLAALPGPDLRSETDPDTDERFGRVTLSFPPETTLGRIRELAHLLSSVLRAEGYTLREDGQRNDTIPGESAEPPEAELGPLDYRQARVCSGLCLSCIFASETRIGCCTEGAPYSLADIAAILLDGGEEFVAKVLALPGELDEDRWHLYLADGRCVFHDPSRGCTLPRERMPLQCRTYLCAPERLLPPEVLSQYQGYVDSLEENEAFVEDHMRLKSGVDFGSPLPDLKEAARRAFDAWASGTKPEGWPT